MLEHPGGLFGAFCAFGEPGKKGTRKKYNLSFSFCICYWLISWVIPNQQPAGKVVCKGDTGPSDLSPGSRRLDEGREQTWEADGE